jgi:hypothetical protein
MTLAFAETAQTDKAAARLASFFIFILLIEETLRRVLRKAKPSPTNPSNSIAQVAGSGTPGPMTETSSSIHSPALVDALLLRYPCQCP